MFLRISITPRERELLLESYALDDPDTLDADFSVTAERAAELNYVVRRVEDRLRAAVRRGDQFQSSRLIITGEG